MTLPSALPLTDKFAVDLLTVARRYAEARGVTLATIGTYAVRNASFVLRIADGNRSFTMANAEQAMIWLSANWPKDLPWPSGIKRPRSRRQSKATAA